MGLSDFLKTLSIHSNEFFSEEKFEENTINQMQITPRTIEMCELGYKFDCDFDGWGTFPDQQF